MKSSTAIIQDAQKLKYVNVIISYIHAIIQEIIYPINYF